MNQNFIEVIEKLIIISLTDLKIKKYWLIYFKKDDQKKYWKK